MAKDIILEAKGINKSFFGVHALKGVDFTLFKGEVHALMGENGAGKSTLMKIISGAHHKDSGTIIYNGEEVAFNSPNEAQKAGISTVYQEGSLVSYLTVAQNIYLGKEPVSRIGYVNKRQLYKKSSEIIELLSPAIKVNCKVKDLSTAQRQLVDIAKAISFNTKIIIMDEPTSSLTTKEIEVLYRIIASLTSQGKSIIFISHKLDEVFAVADRITIFRDGSLVGTINKEDTSHDEVIRKMVGRNIENLYTKSVRDAGEIVLSVNGLSGKGYQDATFEVRKGEVVGFAGLIGAGRTELMRAIFGADKINKGNILISGKKARIKSPQSSIRHGIGLIPEDRKEQGLVLDMSIKENLSLVSLRNIPFPDLRNEKDMVSKCNAVSKKLNIKMPNLFAKVKCLSGGNQQKVVIAKWLLENPKLLILDEPTRGVDVGAKAEIYAIIDDLSKQGFAIIIVSSEMPELLGTCDRIYIMKSGKIVGMLNDRDATEEKIMEKMIKEV